MHPWNVAAALGWNALLAFAVTLPLAWALGRWARAWESVRRHESETARLCARGREDVERAKADAWTSLSDRLQGITAKVDQIEREQRATRTTESVAALSGRRA